MRPLTVEVPDRVAAALDEMVESGWFRSDSDIVSLALREFMCRHPVDLLERFQREDSAWALRQKAAPE